MVRVWPHLDGWAVRAPQPLGLWSVGGVVYGLGAPILSYLLRSFRLVAVALVEYIMLEGVKVAMS